MISLNRTKCCGVLEIDDLSHCNSPEEALRSLAKDLRIGYVHNSSFGEKSNVPVPFVTFTGVVGRAIPDHASERMDNYGEAFANYLEHNGLGVVLDSYDRKNWTGNMIRLWIWHPDYEVLFPFLDKLGV